jgi:hypothetical protein
MTGLSIQLPRDEQPSYRSDLRRAALVVFGMGKPGGRDEAHGILIGFTA